MARLQLRDVRKAYGATMALGRGDLEIAAGEVHVLIGSNGSGKSTLCKIVAGSVAPDSGEILIDGKPVSVPGPRAAAALGIGIFYQELSLAGHRTVAENIMLSRLPVKAGFIVDRDEMLDSATRYIDMFADVSGEGFSAHAIVDTLRADQRQLVEIMKTLASDAPILIFDEPTSALDRAQVDRFFEILGQLREEGRSVIFISHRMDEIFAIGDRVTVIRDGTTVRTSKIAETKPEEVIHLMVGEREELSAELSAPPVSSDTGKVLMSVRDYTGPGFSGVSFDVDAGEIVGFGGLHGQGQSAVLRSLFGAPEPAAGRLELKGSALDIRNPRNAIRNGIAYVSGDRGRDGVIQGRPILENVTPVHFLKNRLLLARPSALRKKALPALEALRTRYAGLWQPVSALSGGNQQKIVIARWLMDKTDVLLLDDPTKGIDLSTKTDLFALIRELAAEGMGIILYSSEDAELLNNADRIFVFNGGSISRELTGADKTRFNLYQAAYEAA